MEDNVSRLTTPKCHAPLSTFIELAAVAVRWAPHCSLTCELSSKSVDNSVGRSVPDYKEEWDIKSPDDLLNLCAVPGYSSARSLYIYHN